MINPFLIMKAVEQEYFLKAGSLIKPNRKPRISEARGIAMYIIRDLCHMSYPEVGEYFARDHSTVMHNCKKIENTVHLGSNKIVPELIIKLTKQLKEDHEH